MSRFARLLNIYGIRLLFPLAILLWATSQARADFEMLLSDGNPADTVALIDSSGTGVISFNGKIGNFSINVTTGLSYPAVGGYGDGILDLNSVDVSTSGGGTLTITLASTVYTGPTDQPYTVTDSINGNMLGYLGGTATFSTQAWANPNDQSPLSGGVLSSIPSGSVPLFGTSSYSVSGTGITDINGLATGNFTSNGTGNYSLFEQTQISFGSNGGLVSYDGIVQAVCPAPPGLVMALSGGLPLLALGWLRRRLRKA